jgi:hypothetical protein
MTWLDNDLARIAIAVGLSIAVVIVVRLWRRK